MPVKKNKQNLNIEMSKSDFIFDHDSGLTETEIKKSRKKETKKESFNDVAPVPVIIPFGKFKGQDVNVIKSLKGTDEMNKYIRHLEKFKERSNNIENFINSINN